MFNVAVLTPSTGICRMGYAQSLARLAMYFAQNRIFEDEPVQSFIVDSIEGSGISENYARLISKYLADGDGIRWTHIFCIEDDMSFRADLLHTMARRKLPIVAANYTTNKGDPIRWVSVGLDGKSIVTNSKSSGLEEALYIAQGATLIAREVFETMGKPWFLMGYDPDRDQYVHQDYYFSQRARDCGFKLFVDHDASKLIRHTGPKNYSWEDMEKQYANTA